jgi:hypothetical protein
LCLIKFQSIFSPGAYELDVEKNRKVQMIHSFGGQTHLMPIVETKCITAGSDKVKINKFKKKGLN